MNAFHSLRPDRPLPPDLIEVLENNARYVKDGTARILRRKRTLPTMTWLGMAMVVLLMTASLVALVFVGFSGFFSTLRLVIGFVFWTVILASMAMTIRRIRKDESYLLISYKYLAFVGDPLGVQWADLDEVTAISVNPGVSGAIGTMGAGAGGVAASLEVVYKNGDVEPIFVGEEFVDSELDHWQNVCNDALVFT